MMRSMFAGVSGLRNHQTRMDVIGNNIANVNTIGFKSSRVTFQDTLNQMLRGASAPQGSKGGTNPLQVGLGMSIATIDVLQTQGNLQNTGNISDLAIQGDGFFVLSDGARQYYTRAGNFNLEADGRLVNPANGLVVQGWMADRDGNIIANGPVTNLQLPLGQTIDPIATTLIEFGGNLDSKTFGTLSYPDQTITDNDGKSFRLSFTLTATSNYNEFEYVVSVDNGTITGDTATGRITLNLDGTVKSVTGGPFIVTAAGSTTSVTINPPNVGDLNGGAFVTNTTPLTSLQGTFKAPDPLVTSTRIYDSLGNAHNLTTIVTKVSVNSWVWETTDPQGNVIGNGTLNFDTTGRLVSAAGTPITFTPTGAETVVINPDFSNVTQFASSTSEITSPSQNGYPMGELQSYNIDSTGQIIGVFSNGLTKTLAQIAVASFTNPAGLTRSGDSLFSESNNSGTAQIGVAGQAGRGQITTGALEMSNVDLAQEFTDMITTQRGYQANSRIITTSDEMLQELVNLKR